MTERYEKSFGPVDSARERSGLYKLGFDPESLKGFMLPCIIAAGGVIGAILISRL
ncbi:MAG: hypothetical protein KF883_07475 [Thermomicrobiales bacterium]|jgi:hypothetical protein|nr:hypothetical protein [Thermomicrobiales bacterium]MCC6944451.1 hypothetical protein [Thermomicrobiales bacterium]